MPLPSSAPGFGGRPGRPLSFLARASLRLVAGLLLAGLMAACAGLPPPVALPRTQALDQPEATRLGRLARAAAPHPAYSGIRLLVSGEDALATLVTLADQAERTLDLQYYLITNEASSRTLLRRVHAAAQRGVRVRLLVDDLNTAGEDESLMCLTRHPRIEVRLYNPFPAGRFSTVTRVLASLTDIQRINQRMHGKMFIADNAIGVTGGRNIGDAYFVQSPTSNFVDLDVLAAGPVVRGLSASFDAFWNSALAYPVTALVKTPPDCAGGVAAQPAPSQALSASSHAEAVPEGPPPGPGAGDARDAAPVPPSALAEDVARGVLNLRWVPAAVLADAPSKIASEGQPDQSETIADDIMALMRSAQRELLVISPYFVPGPQGVALMGELRERGVQVRVLTNSLAATDAPAVHIGYSKYRPDLLRLGVELHELRPSLGRPRTRLGSYGSSTSSLHAKAMVVDRRTVLIGSMNMDPRSAQLNTEIGLVIRSPVLAGELVRLYEDVARASSYRLELVSPDSRALRWRSAVAEVPTVEGREPGAGLGTQLMLMLLTPFAPEEML